jgi:hypothetical protein
MTRFLKLKIYRSLSDRADHDHVTANIVVVFLDTPEYRYAGYSDRCEPDPKPANAKRWSRIRPEAGPAARLRKIPGRCRGSGSYLTVRRTFPKRDNTSSRIHVRVRAFDLNEKRIGLSCISYYRGVLCRDGRGNAGGIRNPRFTG